MSEIPIALNAYEQLADAYAERVDTKDYNAYYEMPAMLSLLPRLDGLRALDAACGPGRYAEWMVNHRAEVTAFDLSPRMLAHARRRLGTKAQIERADMTESLTFLADQSFDLVVCALALDYVRDWRQPLREFHRVLTPGGYIVFSMEHPLSDFSLREAGDYFSIERVEYTWRHFGPPVVVPSFRRPLMIVFNELTDAGFSVDRVAEPLPTQEFKAQNPDDYERLMRRPSFLCIRAQRQ